MKNLADLCFLHISSVLLIAENRLIEVKNRNNGNTIATYAYDYMARRITKTVGFSESNFVYDGFNLIARFAGTSITRSYVWGADINGVEQGAGGVGGLLSVNDSSATYYPTYDANGNVSEYVDSVGTAVAHYEYDSFGKSIASGVKSGDFSHQFSTKQLDIETGLHYYIFRYYDSSMGTWLNRDPAEEAGGDNLYAFVENDPINGWDYNGLWRDEDLLHWGRNVKRYSNLRVAR